MADIDKIMDRFADEGFNKFEKNVILRRFTSKRPPAFTVDIRDKAQMFLEEVLTLLRHKSNSISEALRAEYRTEYSIEIETQEEENMRQERIKKYERKKEALYEIFCQPYFKYIEEQGVNSDNTAWLQTDISKLYDKDIGNLPFLVELNDSSSSLSDAIGVMSIKQFIKALFSYINEVSERYKDINGSPGLINNTYLAVQPRIAIILALDKHVPYVTVPKYYKDKIREYLTSINDYLDSKTGSIPHTLYNLPHVQDYLHRWNTDIRRGKSKHCDYMKIGKLIGTLMPNLSNYAIEIISDTVKEKVTKQGDILKDRFEIVQGEDIVHYYNSFNNSYIDDTTAAKKQTGGELKQSCMRYTENYGDIKFYADNPDRVKLLILKSKIPGKILGRALLWYPGDGNTYVDRVFSISSNCDKLFLRYINTNNLINIYPGALSVSSSEFILKDLVKSKEYAYDFPYLDSLRKEFAYLTKDGNMYITLSYRTSTNKIKEYVSEIANNDNVKYITSYRSSRELMKVAPKEKQVTTEDLYRKVVGNGTSTTYKNKSNTPYGVYSTEVDINEDFFRYGLDCTFDHIASQTSKESKKLSNPKITSYVEFSSRQQMLGDKRLMSKLIFQSGKNLYTIKESLNDSIKIFSTESLLYQLVGKKNMVKLKSANGHAKFKYAGSTKGKPAKSNSTKKSSGDKPTQFLTNNNSGSSTYTWVDYNTFIGITEEMTGEARSYMAAA